MKDKKEMIILLIATVPLLVFSLFVMKRDTVSRQEILEDGRRVHHIDETYNEASHLSSHIGGLLFYDKKLKDHTFSVYLDQERNQGFRSFHSGSSSFIDRGVQAFYYENFGTAIFSMNKKHISEVRYGDEIKKIDSEKPFVLTFDDNITDIRLYDENGSLIKVDQFDVPVSSDIQMINEKIKDIGSPNDVEPSLFIEYAGIYHSSLNGPNSDQDAHSFDDFIKTNQPRELVENQLNDLTVKAGFTLRLDFNQAPTSYVVYSWYEPDIFDQVQIMDDEFTVSSHRSSEIYLVKASYDFGEKYYVFEVDIVDYYTVIPGVIYHVLDQEYLDNTYEDHSRFTRVYWTYDGIKDEAYPSTVAIAIDKVETLLQARDYLKSNYLDDIMFLENTVISNAVINQWLLEGYQPDVEYHIKSKKGLTYKEIKELN